MMPVVDPYELDGLVPVEHAEREVFVPGPRVQLPYVVQLALGFLEQRQQLGRRDVLLRQYGIGRPPAASRNAAAQEDERRYQRELGTGGRRCGGAECLADSDHPQAAVMHVHADRPFGHGGDTETGFRYASPKLLETKVNRFHFPSVFSGSVGQRQHRAGTSRELARKIVTISEAAAFIFRQRGQLAWWYHIQCARNHERSRAAQETDRCARLPDTTERLLGESTK